MSSARHPPRYARGMTARAFLLAAAAVAACSHSKKPVVEPGPVGPPTRDTSNDAAIIDAKVHDLVDSGAVSHLTLDISDAAGATTPAVDFLQVDALRLIIGGACLHDGTLDCDAFEAVKRFTSVKVELGAGNPAAYYCRAAGGRDVQGTSPAGASALCRFPDGSIVDDWSFQYTPNLALGL